MTTLSPASCNPSAGRGTSRHAFSNLSLPRKVALIPALTLLLMALMVTVGVRMGERNTAALQSLDRDVFEPLDRALRLKDGVTLLHARLFALLSGGTTESDLVAQQAKAAALIVTLDAEVANLARFLDGTAAVLPPVAGRLHAEFTAYAAGVRETAAFAAYDASYGALLAGPTDDHFIRLRADLDAVVQALAQRRVALVSRSVRDSLAAQHLLLGLGLGAAMLAMLGSFVVGRSIARPVLRLTALMNRLADGDTEVAVPGTARRDEVGAMARAVEVFRGNAIGRLQGEVALRRTNMQFDVALNSMLQGMVVWGPDFRLQLVNGRFFTICGMPAGSLTPGQTVREVIDTAVSHGHYPNKDHARVCSQLVAMLTARRSTRVEIAMRPGLLVRLTSEPMANGGAVVTLEDVTEQRQNEAQISFLARHDALTGLPNRLLFEDHMSVAVARLGEGRQFAVLCLDLDHFKEVNDTLGHAAGDEVLRLVAGRLERCVGERDMIARLGGDEFAIVLGCAFDSPASATLMAAELVRSIAAPYEVQGHQVVIGTSIGIALSAPGLTGAELLKRADVALYQAKEERGCFAFFEPGMDEILHARRELEADLRLALHREEFELNYQPLYNLAEDRVTGFEALVRWNSPSRGRVAPNDFIPLAEQTGLILPLGAWVLHTACAEAASWPEHVRVAVNLSPVQFKDRQLVAMVRETLAATGLPAQRLELEITEMAMLQDSEAVMTILHGLHDLGIRISMDDFGTGYSSLSYLRRFPFDKIKIDRSFVNELPLGLAGSQTAAGKSAAMIVRAITGLGQNLGISTTAEGVETANQLALIRHEGCTEVQGYFISRPRPAADIPAMIAGKAAPAANPAHSPVPPLMDRLTPAA